MTRETILSLQGTDLAEAMAVQVMGWPKYEVGPSPPEPYFYSCGTHLIAEYNNAVERWQPHLDLNQAHECEAALTDGQQRDYATHLREMTARRRDRSDYDPLDYFVVAHADATTRCHAILLAVLNPEN